MSDTPRTDAVIDEAAWRSPHMWVTQLGVLEDHARELERELAAAREFEFAILKALSEPRPTPEQWAGIRAVADAGLRALSAAREAAE